MNEIESTLTPERVCPTPLAICEALCVIEDPRRAQARRHPLIGILVMSLCAIACGGNGWDEIADIADCHFSWFKSVVPCGKEAPSADTFRRVIQAIRPESFQRMLQEWLKRCALEKRPGRQVCFDGKALRGSKKVHIVNAYDPDDGIILGQIAVQDKENEISALPRLDSIVELEGTICTGDAMFTQRKIVERLRERGADYILALKSNQKGLFEAVQKEFGGNYATTKKLKTLDKNRGWVEERTLKISSRISKIDPKKKWADLEAVIELTSQRNRGDEFTIETRYFIASLADAEVLLERIRKHWGIENGLHRTLDIHFREDACQVREKIAAENLSMLRKIAGSILHQLDPNRTLKSKMRRMMASDSFREGFLSFNGLEER